MASRPSIRRCSFATGNSRRSDRRSTFCERGGTQSITKPTTPLLDELAEALKPDWYGTRAAGRVERGVEILRDVAHLLSPRADRPDRPANAAEAEAQFNAYLANLQATAPRMGLGAADGHFVDHVVKLSERYSPHIFVCFDDPRVPPTTDELEGFFGEYKSFVKRCNGTGSTANGLVQSLGDSLLRAFHDTKHRRITPSDGPVVLAAFREARAEIAKAEAPARRRRSLVRNLDENLARLVARRRTTSALAVPVAPPDSPSVGAAAKRSRL